MFIYIFSLCALEKSITNFIFLSKGEISKCNRNIGATLQNMSISSQNLLRNTSETLDDLKDSAVVSETEIEDAITERPITSMSNECLPDPTNLDIPDSHPGEYFFLL